MCTNDSLSMIEATVNCFDILSTQRNCLVLKLRIVTSEVIYGQLLITFYLFDKLYRFPASLRVVLSGFSDHSFEALFTRSCPMISSKTNADCVCKIASPSFRVSSSAPGAKVMYCSPNRPAVKILACVSIGK